YLKSDTFSLIDFNRLIMDLRNSGELFECGKGAVSQETVAEVDIPYSRSPKEKVYADAGKSRNIRNIILLQPVFLVAAAIICLLLVLRKAGDIVSISGVVLIASALDILVIKRLWDNQGKRES